MFRQDGDAHTELHDHCLILLALQGGATVSFSMHVLGAREVRPRAGGRGAVKTYGQRLRLGTVQITVQILAVNAPLRNDGNPSRVAAVNTERDDCPLY